MKNIFPVCSCLAFVGFSVFILFQGFKDAPFVKFVGKALAALFDFAISAFAHG